MKYEYDMHLELGKSGPNQDAFVSSICINYSFPEEAKARGPG